MSSNKYAIGQKKNKLYEIGPGFWNVRGHFRIFARMIDIGTQMSIAQLANGNFLVIDTVELDGHLRMQIDQLTANGELIEGVIGTHPAHIQSFQAFYEAYPQAAYYGTPRHLHVLSQIPWLGSVDDCNVRRKWEPDIEMRIPAGKWNLMDNLRDRTVLGIFPPPCNWFKVFFGRIDPLYNLQTVLHFYHRWWVCQSAYVIQSLDKCIHLPPVIAFTSCGWYN